MPSLVLSPPKRRMFGSRTRAAEKPRAGIVAGTGLRKVVQAGVLIAIVALLANTWLLSGIVVPAFVSGSSMAPTLLGPHVRWQCPGCERAVCCDVEALPSAGEDAICPHCGAHNEVAAGTLQAGDRLLIDRTAYSLRAPKRWETVALHSPEEDGSLCVKRIVGLPGENIEIADGDVVVDGHRQRKPLAVQLAMALAVAGAGDLDRWHSAREGAWKLIENKWQHAAGTAGRIDWLEYQHREPVTPGGKASSPILDGSPVNQNESRKLNPVSDVVLRCTLQGAEADKAFFTIHARGDEFRVILPIGGGGARLSHNGTRVKGGRVEPGQHAKMAVEVVVTDGRFSIRAGGKPVLEYEFEPLPPRGDGGPRVAIGADAAALAVGGLEVLRDVHFTPGPEGQTRYRLGPDEYFVLGDNSANSVDSRTWKNGLTRSARGGVRGEMLLGPVLAW